MVKLIIGEKVRTVPQSVVDVLIEVAKEKYINERKNAIVAIEKDNVVDMRKDEFKYMNDINAAIKSHEALGFKVHYAKRW